MNLRIGIVGLPNAGKSTLFNALLKKQVADAAPYPFCTIEPNVGIVPVPDARLIRLAEITKEENTMDSLPPVIPAVVEFVDIAGLVKGASKGEGLGNKFLSHIREVNIICHVIREFTDDNVVHTSGTLDAKRDKEIIETELILADLQTLDKQSEPRGVKDSEVQKKWGLILKLKEGLNSGKNAREVIPDEEDRLLISDLHLLSMKPVLDVYNVSENKLTTYNLQPSAENMYISAKIESEISSLPENEQKEYLSTLGLEESGLDRLIRKTYDMLGLISFLTCGVKEVRAWTISKGITAQEASGVIHTDFEKKFIKADIIGFEQFIRIKGWKNARTNGLVRQEGRGYHMQDGEVVEFKIGS